MAGITVGRVLCHMALSAVYRRGARPCALTRHHETRPSPRNPSVATKSNPPPNEKPSPSGRGLGEGEMPGAGQRRNMASAGQRRKPPKSPPFAKGGLFGGISPALLLRHAASPAIPRPPTAFSTTSGWRCFGCGIGVGVGVGIKSLHPPLCERGAFWGLRRPDVPEHPDAHSHSHTTPPSFPRKRESTPRPIATPGLPGVLDSGAGRNDGGAVCGIRRWAAQYDSPSPNPLPLGEGF